MPGKGHITERNNQRFRLLIAGHALWLATVCLLGAWWGRVLLKQAGLIAELETKLGLAPEAVAERLLRTRRMLIWESAAFFVLLTLVMVILIALYWREARRARALQAFFASVTHELRTPLTSIRLQAESIGDQLAGRGESTPLVRRLLEDTSRLESQVERTLELARVEGGGQSHPEPMRLKQWAGYFVESARLSYGDRVRLSAAVDDVVVGADTSSLQIVLRNLIDNSLRHASKDDGIEARLSTERRQGGWVVLRYGDSGGPVRADVSKLGRLFYRGTGSQGAGVGLYLVRTLMRRMGGRAEFLLGPHDRGLVTELWLREQGDERHG